METAVPDKKMEIPVTDRAVLRDLAARRRAVADSPEQAALRRAWTGFNALKPERPMVLVSPEGAWPELVPDAGLACTNPAARGWERNMRYELYSVEVLKADQLLDPYFSIGWAVDRGDFGVAAETEHGADRGSYRWEPPLKNLNGDLEKLSFRQPVVNRIATLDAVALADDVFGDILPVRIQGTYWWTCGLTWEAIKLIGLEGLMLAMYDNPAGLHRLMAWLRDEQMHYMEWFEKEDLLSQNTSGQYVGSGGVGCTDQLPEPAGAVKRADMWGFAESQETVGVSPEMFREFILPYQLPLLEKFGLNCYGCCEGVHDRLDDITAIPRMRRISVAPWADQKMCAGKMEDRFIFSRKPNPAHVCAGFNEKAVREDLRSTLEVTEGCVLEIILKDTHTVQNEPERLSRWVEMAREEIGKAGRQS